MLRIRSRKINISLSIVLCACMMSVSYGQQYNRAMNPNFNKFQNKPFYYGIGLGLHTATFRVTHSAEFLANHQYEVIEGLNGPGFNIGVIGNLKIGHYFDLRSMLNFAFVSRTIEYRPIDSDLLERQSLSSTLVEVPFLIRYKSAPYRDKRAFVVAGFKYLYDASNKANVNTETFELKISPHDFQFEIGAGMQFFLPYFILSPEIKFSQGVGNILIFNQTSTKNKLLDQILSRTITLTFNIEG